MNYAYIEPKMFLATQEFDAARHFEAMRHRALCNGGALGLESPGFMSRRMLETRAGWPEVAVSMYIARGVLTLMLYRFGAHFAGNPVDRPAVQPLPARQGQASGLRAGNAQAHGGRERPRLRRIVAPHPRFH